MIETNLGWLRQALDLLERMDDTVYAASPAHLRHIIEFYQAFLEGAGSRQIDYDARRRDPRIERSRKAAAAAIESVMRHLRSFRALRFDAAVRVRIDNTVAKSTVGRELQFLSSHTVHHFALIAITLRLHSVGMPPDFGVAPSTLRYQATRAAEAA